MKCPLLAAALMIVISTASAQTDRSLKKAFLCQQEGGPTVLVKDNELPNVRDALCRAIEYKHASDSRLLRCKLHKQGSTFTDQQLFSVEAGCTILNQPLE